MALAIFDLDNTLIAGDSDHAWGEYLAENKIVDPELHQQENDRFYNDYLEGCLDIYDYLDFSLAPLARHSKSELDQWRQDFFDTRIKAIILPKGRALLDQHRAKGDTLLIITATNRFVTQPIADALDVEHLIAIELEENAQGYTGKCRGIPSYKEGKISRLNEWLEQHPHTLEGASFYSDSHNDLPLLKLVDHPVAVDPDETLKRYCEEHDWPIISLRETESIDA